MAFSIMLNCSSCKHPGTVNPQLSGGTRGDKDTARGLEDRTGDRQTNSSFLAQKGALGPRNSLPNSEDGEAQIKQGAGRGENERKGRFGRKIKGIQARAEVCAQQNSLQDTAQVYRAQYY